jgi:hypothetical protein
MQKSRVVNFLFPVILKIMPLRNTRKGGSTKEIKIGDNIKKREEEKLLNLSSYFHHLNVTDLTRREKIALRFKRECCNKFYLASEKIKETPAPLCVSVRRQESW